MKDYLEQMRSFYLDRLPDGWWEQRKEDRQYQEDRPAVYAPGPDDYRRRDRKDEEEEGCRRVIIIDYSDDEEDDKKKGPIEMDIKDIPAPDEADSE